MASMKWANNLSVFNGVFHNDVTSGLSQDKPSIFFQQPQKAHSTSLYKGNKYITFRKLIFK
jgi:hypothetical protein